MRFFASSLLLLSLSCPAYSDSLPVDAAVLGDSISTGGGSHPALKYDVNVLWDVFNNKIGVAPDAGHLDEYYRSVFDGTGMRPPVRLWPTMREFFGGPDWVYRNLLSYFSQKFLDTEQYSWGYLASRDLGFDGTRLGIAAEDGARVVSMPRQIDRILERTGGRLPPKVFVFYTGNDLCGMDPAMITSASDYRTNLMRGMTYMARNSGVRRDQGDSPVNVYLISFMSLIQLLDDKEILAKKIMAFGKETTCADLRKAGYRPDDPGYQPALPPEAWYFGMAMPPNPAAFCPTVFMPHKFGEKTISDLANRIREYRQMESEVIGELQKVADQEPYNRLKINYVRNTATLKFAPDEVGEDCFHLSLKGQQKVAKVISEEIGALKGH